nr:RNA-binding domain-containing protein [Candidatus Njordarchaeota archaeon]
MIRIQVEVPVYPTEDPEKVRRALSNIIFGMSFSERVEGGVKYLTGVSEESNTLSQIKRRLKDQSASAFARQTLSKSIKEENKVQFYLNKQAAFMGILHFCETKNESPLGPITVEIESDNIKSAINYITGYTE